VCPRIEVVEEYFYVKEGGIHPPPPTCAVTSHSSLFGHVQRNNEEETEGETEGFSEVMHLGI
jgi:hypothetical protein